MNPYLSPLRSVLSRWLPLMLLVLGATAAMAQSDPPARAATLSLIEGTVAFAPAGETEWADAVVNRPVTRGDRLWTDPGARAELHLGTAALHMASQTFVEVVALDDDVLQLSLNEGAVNARVRQLEGGENFEVTTPQLTFRAAQPGDYRIDADPGRAYTRVTVRSGVAMIYGAGTGVLQLRAGQQMAFTGRELAQLAVAAPAEDSFDRWAADLNRSEDQSISARYVPREVVGYQQLDANGVWSQDPNYGPVWYPTIVVADWAPYRYGRWEWVAPWGWTWIDDARWGFAPFHYGRWAQIGSRWAWVPGRIGRRPVYSPALVVFVGGAGAGSNWNLSVGSGPGIAWFPLAPGEAWRPTYRASNRYLREVNRNVAFNGARDGFIFQRRSDAITAVRVDDFNRGRPVHQHWNRVNAAELGRVQINSQPALPQPRRWAERGREVQAAPPPAAPATARPQPSSPWPGGSRADFGDRRRPEAGQPGEPRPQPRGARELQSPQQGQPAPQMQIEQERARRDSREQQMQQRAQQAQQLERARQDQERAQQAQREQASRYQQAQQMQMQQRQREDALRQQQAVQQQARQVERMQRQQEAAQERMQSQQQWQQRSAPQPQPQLVPQTAVQPPAREPRNEARERAQERGWRGQQREERADPAQDDGNRGRGRGQRIN
jgi:hypothetical protein